MPQQEQYTLDEAKARAKELGKEWTPQMEGALRAAGKIKDGPAVDLPVWQDALLGLGQMVGSPEQRGMASTAERLATGTTAGEQATQGAVRGLTAGNVSLPGIPEAQTGAQKAFQAAGAGVGVVGAMAPLSRVIGPATQGIVNPLLRTAATGSLGFGAYEGLAPAESGSQRLLNVLHGLGVGAGTAVVPMLPGINKIAAIPHVGRPLVDAAQFTGLGMAEGVSFEDAARDAVPMVGMSSVLHAGAGQRADRFQEQVQARAKQMLEADKAARAEAEAKGAAEREAILARNRAETEASRARHDEMLAADRQRAFRPVEQPNADPLRMAEQARVDIQQVSGEARQAAEQGQYAAEQRRYNEFTKDFRRGVEAKRQQNLEAERAAHEERMARVAEVKRNTAGDRSQRPRNVDESAQQQPDQERTFYRGTNPGDTRRIAEPFSEGAGRVFVARAEASARNYGKSIERIVAKPEARILREEDRAFWKLVGRRRPPNGYIGSAARRGETLVDVVNDAIIKAKAAGYDILSFKSDSDIGTVILNNDSVVRAQPPTGRPRNVELNSFGVPNESIDLLRNGLKRLQETGRAVEAKQVERQAEALANRARRGRPAGGLEKLVPGYANRDGSGQMQVIEGIPLSQVLADYGNGKITADQLRRIVKENPDLMNLPDMVRKQLGLPFEKGGQLTEGVDFEPVGPGPFGTGKMSAAVVDVMDRRRIARRSGGGEFNNPAYKASIRLGEQIEMVRDKLNNDLQDAAIKAVEAAGYGYNDPDLPIIARLLDGVYKPGWTIASVTDSAAGQALLAKTKNPDAALVAVKGVADQLVRQADFRDAIRSAIGIKPMPRQGSYWPHTERQYNIRTETMDRLEQLVRERTEALDPTKDPRLYSAREMQRAKESTLREDQINYDLMDVLMKYTLDTTRMFTNSMALTHGQNVADAIHERAVKIRAEGGPEAHKAALRLEGAADAMSAITQFAYGNKLGPVSGGAVRMLNSTTPGKAILASDIAIKNAFNAARYALNLRFMMFTQWTSIGAAAAHGVLTPKEMAEAMKEAASPRIRDEWAESYTRFAKNRKIGMVGNESNLMVDRMASPIDRWRRGKGSEIKERLGAQMDDPTQRVENATGRLAFAFAEKMAEKAGLSPEDARAFKSDFVGLTQSFFDRTNRPGILSTPVLNTAFPAQGYAFEMANTVGDIAAGTAGAKRQTSASGKAARAGAFLGSLYLFQMLNTLLLTKEEDPAKIALENLEATAKSMLPYSSAYAVSGRGRRGGQTYQSRLVAEQMDAAAKIADGDIEGALTGAANSFVKGGGQVKRIVDTNRKIEEGVLLPSERIPGYLVGWDNTDSGKAYMRKRLGIGKEDKKADKRRPLKRR